VNDIENRTHTRVLQFEYIAAPSIDGDTHPGVAGNNEVGETPPALAGGVSYRCEVLLRLGPSCFNNSLTAASS